MIMRQTAWCTLKYFAWISEEDILARTIQEGLVGLKDSRASLQLYPEILPNYLVTPIMYQQVVPGSVDYMLPPSDSDNDVVEYFQIESEGESEEKTQKEHGYQVEEIKEECEEDPKEYPKEKILGEDSTKKN